MKFKTGASSEEGDYWKSAAFEIEPVSRYAESTVAVNALMQYSQDRVTEVSRPRATKAIADLWSDSTIQTEHQIRSSQTQEGTAETKLTFEQAVLISVALAHYSSRTQSAVSRSNILDQGNSRMIEGGIADIMLGEFLNESAELKEAVDQKIAKYSEIPFGFISFLSK